MFIKQGEHTQSARLLSFLALGEEIAHHCAKEQAKQSDNRSIQRFLNSQARQEKYHQIIFMRGELLLTPKGSPCDPAKQSLIEYKRILDEAIKRQDFAETLLGQQVILEGLGEVVLENIDLGMSNRNFGYKKIRHLILNQEHAHHDFGIRKLNQVQQGDPDVQIRLSARVQDYMQLIEKMLEGLHNLFAHFNYDSNDYFNQVQAKLPAWVEPLK